MSERQQLEETLGMRRFPRRERIVAAALAIYAITVPLAVSVVGALRIEPSFSPLIGTLALGLALLGPGLAAIVVAWHGFGAIVRRIAERPDTEPRQAVFRIFFAGLVLAYLDVLAVTDGAGAALLPMAAVDISGLLCAWLYFVHLIARPEAALVRRNAALVSDIAFISAFLHAGGGFAAPWFPVYLGVVLSNGFCFGVAPLIAGATLALIGFAVMAVTTEFWHAQPFITAGITLALVMVPGCTVAPIRRLHSVKAKTDEAAAGMGRFLALVSHELRTPLTSLIGIGALFERTRLDTQQRDMLASLQSSSRALATLVDDLLDYSRFQAGKQSPPVEGFVLHETLAGAVAMLRPEAEAKRLALSLHIDPRLPHAYRGLPMPLRQVAINLIANAIKFTARGRISVSATALKRAPDRVLVQLSVRDDGVGIPPEAQERIFDAFTQADETVARRFGGTGLGLAIAKQFTALMGGSIRVESNVGTGSNFIVELTLEPDLSVPARVPDLFGRRLVLITSDSEFAALLQAQFRTWRGEPSWYADSELAVTALAGEGDAARPALLLIDGRDNPLAALSLAHRITTTIPQQPSILFVAAPGTRGSIADIAASQFGAISEAPIGETALAGALLAMIASDPRGGDTIDGGYAPSARPAAAIAAHPRKILVADDNAANRMVLTTMLQAAGHEVAAVDDGAAALAMLEGRHFDLALLDVNMPEVSGCDVARRYRASQIGEDRVPIVALTADTTRETERLCRDAGMDAVLTKPIEGGQLLAAVDEILAGIMINGRSAAGAPPVVTPISAHPRFMPESAAVIDDTTVAALRTLGGNDFVADVVETFRKDSWRLLDQLRTAIAKGDMHGIRETIHSLRSGGANIGAMRLSQTLGALRDVTVKDLRQTGAGIIEKVEAELTRLDLSLDQLMREQRRV